MWRDVRGKVIQFYMSLFKSYEREGLDINNLTHIYTLQYMFMPRIQEDLNNFKAYWNNHPLESENNRTPHQLILLHSAAINNDMPIDLLHYGVENDDGDVDEDNPQVMCDAIICPLNADNLIILRHNIIPLSMAVPDTQLTNLFHQALRLIIDLISNQE